METFLTTHDGVNLFYKREVEGGEKAVCVIVHGLAEHSGRYDYVAKKLHEDGIGTYRFDHRGHGRSEGERTYSDNFHNLADDTNMVVDIALQENPDKPVFLMGHSMGGLSVALFGVKYPGKRIRGIVASGAATRDDLNVVGGVPPELDDHVQLPNTLGPAVCSVPEIVEAYNNDEYTSKIYTPGVMRTMKKGMDYFNERISTFDYPVLILHGEKDVLVAVAASINFFSEISSTDRQVKVYGGLFHEIFNEYCRDEVIGDAVNWINNRI